MERTTIRNMERTQYERSLLLLNTSPNLLLLGVRERREEWTAEISAERHSQFSRLATANLNCPVTIWITLRLILVISQFMDLLRLLLFGTLLH